MVPKGWSLTLAAASLVAAFAMSCDRSLSPESYEPGQAPWRLQVDAVLPQSDTGGARVAAQDTGLSITRAMVTVTEPDGTVIFASPFMPRDDDWDIGIAISPRPQVRVRVDAWHHDALLYTGVDSSVAIPPDSVVTARIVLEGRFPQLSLVVAPNASDDYAISVDPRATHDPSAPTSSLKIRYDWQNDGVWDTGYMNLVPYIGVYPAGGAYTLRAEVRNPAGLVARATTPVTFGAASKPPVARFSMTPAEGAPGTTFLADAAATFAGLPEACGIAVRWDWEGDGRWDTPWMDEPGAGVRLTESGTYLVTMQVRDGAGRMDTAQERIAVVSPDRKPVASLAVTPFAPRRNDLVTADAGHSSSGGDGALVYRWDWDGDGVWDTDWLRDRTATHAYQTAGTRTVRVSVMTASGDTAVAASQVMVADRVQFGSGEAITVDGVSMRYIPQGIFDMGSGAVSVDELPVHRMGVAAFLMDTYEVTNAQYLRFVVSTGHAAPPHWIGGSYPAGQGALPVVDVTWEDAAAYAAWRGARLPSEAEWEYATRGTDGRTYPWGNAMSPDRANYGDNPVMARGSFPAGASPFGLQDMAGNVAEMTADHYRPYPGFEKYTLVDPGTPGYTEGNGLLISGNPFTAKTRDAHTIRGGSVGIDLGTNGIELRATNRDPFEPGARSSYVGFRCARDLD